MNERLEAGQHPDTHLNFWNAWVEPSSPPPLPGGSAGFYLTRAIGIGIVIGIIGLPIVVLVVVIRALSPQMRRAISRVARPSP